VKLLADTSALLALTMKHDQNHTAAASFVRTNPRVRFVLTDLILVELVTLVRSRAGVPIAVGTAKTKRQGSSHNNNARWLGHEITVIASARMGGSGTHPGLPLDIAVTQRCSM